MTPSGFLEHHQHQHDERISTTVLEQALREVARRIPNLRWATIASLNGIVQTTYDPFGKEQPDRILAMTSAVLALGDRVFRKLQRGQLAYLALAGDTGALIGYPIGKEYILAVSISAETKVGIAAGILAQASSALGSVLYPRIA